MRLKQCVKKDALLNGLLPVYDFCKEAGIQANTMYDYIKEGKIKAIEFMGIKVIDRSELSKFSGHNKINKSKFKEPEINKFFKKIGIDICKDFYHDTMKLKCNCCGNEISRQEILINNGFCFVCNARPSVIKKVR